MKKIFNLLYIFILFTPVLLTAQYSKQDYELVKTTFYRKFDYKIVLNYLKSGETKKTNAALLSIAQSENKSFIPEILKLDFSNYSEFICFTLGQLGPDKSATEFLLKHLTEESLLDNQRYAILNTIGKIGDSASLVEITDNYLKINNDNYDGISISLFDFFSRRLFEKDKFISILRNELINQNYTTTRKRDAAFAIYRINLSEDFKELSAELLRKELLSGSDSEEGISFKQYLFENLRKAKFFPNDLDLLNASLSQKEPMLRIVAAKALPYFRFNSFQQIDSYLKLLFDTNPVVSRQAAISIGELNFHDSLKNKLVANILQYFDDNRLTPNVKGELFLNYINFNPLSFEKTLNKFTGHIEPEYLYRASGQNINSKSALNFLVGEFKSNSDKKRILILQEIVKFQKSFPESLELMDVIFSALSSNSPALISIAADGIDSILISGNKNKLSSICKSQINKYLKNSEYAEGLISLYNLAELIGSNVSDEIIKKFKTSPIYTVRKFVNSKLDLPQEAKDENSSLLDSIWNNAFKYKSAIVNTDKSSFEIKFLPGFAPVSVGNFCYLASQKYFNNIAFHRVVPGFVIQSGDSSSTGWSGPGYEIVSEFSPLHYYRNVVGMASSGKDTEGSQWFVTTGYFPHLDRRYTIFGYTTEGVNAVNTIDQNDRIKSIELTY